eukprot:TRINITY_DN2724_c3_g1_i1.p1 TRINITY_DN2724_c3_g1~~TRINITY_DN2724_c3_g1_i1.p1  ORF type:complete len:445 (+),score=154.77 TRINITY_DN2724_c3_g1_i1:197-1336(+)
MQMQHQLQHQQQHQRRLPQAYNSKQRQQHPQPQPQQHTQPQPQPSHTRKPAPTDIAQKQRADTFKRAERNKEQRVVQVLSDDTGTCDFDGPTNPLPSFSLMHITKPPTTPMTPTPQPQLQPQPTIPSQSQSITSSQPLQQQQQPPQLTTTHDSYASDSDTDSNSDSDSDSESDEEDGGDVMVSDFNWTRDMSALAHARPTLSVFAQIWDMLSTWCTKATWKYLHLGQPDDPLSEEDEHEQEQDEEQGGEVIITPPLDGSHVLAVKRNALASMLAIPLHAVYSDLGLDVQQYPEKEMGLLLDTLYLRDSVPSLPPNQWLLVASVLVRALYFNADVAKHVPPVAPGVLTHWVWTATASKYGGLLLEDEWNVLVQIFDSPNQ